MTASAEREIDETNAAYMNEYLIIKYTTKRQSPATEIEAEIKWV